MALPTMDVRCDMTSYTEGSLSLPGAEGGSPSLLEVYDNNIEQCYNIDVHEVNMLTTLRADGKNTISCLTLREVRWDLRLMCANSDLRTYITLLGQLMNNILTQYQARIIFLFLLFFLYC